MDEQHDPNDNGDERNDSSGDEHELNERRRTLLAIRGDLFQACCFRPRMMNEPAKLGLDQLAGLEFLWRPSSVLRGANFLERFEVIPGSVRWLRIAHRWVSAARTTAGFIGTWRSRTPVASKNAFAIAGKSAEIGSSPHPPGTASSCWITIGVTFG